MNSNRHLNFLLDSLGCDPTGIQPGVENTITPVYVVDETTFALPSRGNTRLYVSANPTTAAAQFSGIELVGLRGFWVRRLVCTTNVSWGVTTFTGTALAVTDAQLPVTYALPEGYPDTSMFPAAIPTGAAIVSAPATPGFPVLFPFGGASQGRYAATAGIFGIANRDLCLDLWVPAGAVLRVMNNTVNAGVVIAADLDFPASVLFG